MGQIITGSNSFKSILNKFKISQDNPFLTTLTISQAPTNSFALGMCGVMA